MPSHSQPGDLNGLAAVTAVLSPVLLLLGLVALIKRAGAEA